MKVIRKKVIMMNSKNKMVRNFIEGMMIMDAEKYNSLIEMRKIVFDIYPI